MKKIYLYTLLLGLLGLTSCETDHTPVLSVKATAVLEEMPQSAYAFNTGNANDPFVIKWTPTDFGFQAVNVYSVVLTNKSNGNFIKLGDTSANELSLTNAQMNAFAGSLFAYPGKATDFNISLSYSAYSGKLDSIAGNILDVTMTPYDPKTVAWSYVYVAEGYPNFDFTKAYMLGDLAGDGLYEGYVNFVTDGTFAILDGANMNVLSEGNSVINKGFCKLNFNGSDVTQSAPIVWGVVGDATPGSWDSDTQMEYDGDSHLWQKIVRLIKDKEFKFRGNNDWGINYGAIAGKEMEMGGDLVSDGANMKVVFEKDTTFLVTLNLTEAGKYSYTMVVASAEQSSEYITMPGSYQGWSPEDPSCYKLTSPGRDFIFSGAGYMSDNTEFKLYDKGTWTGINGAISWNGDKTGGSFKISLGGGGNILIDKGNYYKFVVNMNEGKLNCTFTQTSWSLIGSGSPSGNWDNDTMMSYDPNTKLWSVTANLVGGEMKFRWDRGWDKNLGGSLDALVPGGNNIVVPAGMYTIVLDEANLKATMTKK